MRALCLSCRIGDRSRKTETAIGGFDGRRVERNGELAIGIGSGCERSAERLVIARHSPDPDVAIDVEPHLTIGNGYARIGDTTSFQHHLPVIVEATWIGCEVDIERRGLIFAHGDIAAAHGFLLVLGDVLCLDAELSIGLVGRNGHRTLQLSEPVGGESVGCHLLAFGIEKRDLEQSVGQCFLAVDAHLAAQHRIVDGLVRAIDGKVGQDLYLFLRIVFGLLEVSLLLVFLSDKGSSLGIDKDLENGVAVGMIDSEE